ncbi:uncharacterized protein yc1106_01260 [Curvularia clavata]|uniref:Uncharacterized protein n=1 Tax=Curvularia clavata TaxID=95742 RepID=A0A9Q9DQ44_CURCL|nr:uncharacterized protein yc1106_01260 [Curvularia clavata]
MHRPKHTPARAAYQDPIESRPLNVVCFSPLKRKYGDAVSGLVRNRTNYISKETFLLAFKAAFKQSITKENI